MPPPTCICGCIIDAAYSCLSEPHSGPIPVAAILQRAGVSTRAFYRHFDDVTALLLRLLSDLGGELYAVAERWAGQAYAEHPVAAHERLSDIVDFFVTHGPLVRAGERHDGLDGRVRDVELAVKGARSRRASSPGA